VEGGGVIIFRRFRSGHRCIFDACFSLFLHIFVGTTDRNNKNIISINSTLAVAHHVNEHPLPPSQTTTTIYMYIHTFDVGTAEIAISQFYAVVMETSLGKNVHNINMVTYNL
jgi:hypothetical protein